jgi:hypothetical protein
MSNQEQRQNTGSRVGVNPALGVPSAPNVAAVLNRAHRATDKIRVVHGANESYFDNLSGKTVGSVRKNLREVFNIPGDAEAKINGKTVGDDFILEAGSNLEFLKSAGEKGIALP